MSRDEPTGEVPTVFYGDALFARVCPECSRFVKPDQVMYHLHNDFTDEDRFDRPNATCKAHGRVLMPFLGYFDPSER